MYILIINNFVSVEKTILNEIYYSKFLEKIK